MVASSAPPLSAGGVASAHFNLFLALKRRGIKTRFFTFGDQTWEDSEDVVRRGPPKWLVGFIGILNKLFFAVISPGKHAFQLADILKSLVGARLLSREISKFDPDVVILSDHGAPGLMLHKKEGRKIILVSHHNPARFTGGDFSNVDVRLAVRLEQHVVDKVDAIVCPSLYMMDWLNETFHFAGPIKVVPNVFDELSLEHIAPFDLRRQIGLSPNDLLIYMPGAGGRFKGAQYLATIVERISNLTEAPTGFYVSGSVMPNILGDLSNLPSQARLCLAGQVTYEEHIANVKACSFGISPALFENYSMALLEAVHCGVPMVAFATGGNPEIIHNGENGYLAPVGDVEALLAAAEPLLRGKNLELLKRRTASYSKEALASEKALSGYLELMNSL